MDVQKNVCFVSKLRYLNVQKDPGFTVQKAVPGGTTAINLPAEFVKFKEHRCLTNIPEIIEFLRKVMGERPQLGIREIREKTKVELYDEEMAKLKDQVARTEKAKANLPPTEEEKLEQKKGKDDKIVKSAEEVIKPKQEDKTFKCWLGRCTDSFGSAMGLQKHLRLSHKKTITIASIVRKFNELAKENRPG